MRSGLLLLMLALPPAALGQERTPLPLPAAGNVTLPLDEYNRLLELAGKPVKEPPAPPQPYALESADLAFEVAGEKASGKILLEGEVFRAGATKVPLVAGLTILDAQQRGKDLPLQQEGGARIAVLSGPAAFSIALDTAFPLVIEAGRASFSLPVPAAGAVRLTLVVPGDHTSVNITPGLITGRASAAGRTTIQATLAPGQNTSIWWAARESVAPAVPKEVRFLSDIKTLVSVSELQLAAAALVDIQVVQGEPSQFEIEMPAGCELTGVTGAALESSEVQGGVLILKVTRPQLRSYQFLVSLEKPIDQPKTGAPLLRLKGAQRETGEILVEGEGTIELTAQEAGGLKRMDLRETTPFLRSMAHNSPQAAFRYHRQQSEPPALSLEWVRFPEGKLLAAVAQEAVVTTMVTPEGKSLTEVKLILRNRAQPFLKVALSAGASIVSADVAGERVKPVQGPDGSRVPLLRPGFHPVDSYPVSFVFMHSGAPFARKGGAEIALPKMDLPIGLLEWEIFLPERYKVADFGGDAIPANLLTPSSPDGAPAAYANPAATFDGNLLPGQVGGLVVDPTGAVVPGAQVSVVHLATGFIARAVADSAGRWKAAGIPSGRIRITVDSQGFQRLVREIDYDAVRPSHYSFALQVGSISESVEVTSSTAGISRESRRVEDQVKKDAAAAQNAPSVNIVNLQRRVAGVLPIPVEVPRSGRSFRFARPLVIDEETKVTFTYKTR